jgi:hypothetical protein
MLLPDLTDFGLEAEIFYGLGLSVLVPFPVGSDDGVIEFTSAGPRSYFYNDRLLLVRFDVSLFFPLWSTRARQNPSACTFATADDSERWCNRCRDSALPGIAIRVPDGDVHPYITITERRLMEHDNCLDRLRGAVDRARRTRVHD